MVGGGRKTWSLQTLQVLIALYAPYTCIGTATAAIACYLYDPTMSVWLYSSFPDTCRGPILLLGCLAVELHFTAVVVTNSGPLFQIHVAFLDRINEGLFRVASSSLHR